MKWGRFIATLLLVSFSTTGTTYARQDDKTVLTSSEVAAKHGARFSLCIDGQAGRYPCENMNLLAYMTPAEMGVATGVGLNDGWGWSDEETGRRYMIVAREDGVSFVDVTHPESPVFVGQMRHTLTAQPNVWRDVKVNGQYAYIVADGSAGKQGLHGMQIFDLNRLRQYSGTPLHFSEDALYSEFVVAHNVFINEETNRAYVVGARGGGQFCGGGFHIADISDPLNPAFLGCFTDVGTGRSRTGYTHDVQCVIYHGPDTFYSDREICVGSNETAISIADVTHAQSPIAISRGTYPTSAYVHQGWFTDDHRYFIQNDELDERVSGGPTRTMVWDLSDLNDPVLAVEYESDYATIDHNLYLRDGLAYQANYTAGLHVVDMRDPLHPGHLGFFDTVPERNDVTFGGAWTAYPFPDSDLVAIVSRQEGLFLVEPTQLLQTRVFTPEASVQEGLVELEWKVVQDAPIVEYQIESRATEGEYEMQGSVLPSGSTGEKSYQFSFPIPDGAHDIRVRAVAGASGSLISGEISVVSLSGSFLLPEPYPNPAIAMAKTSLIVDQNQFVNATVFDMNGRLVTTFYDDYLNEGVPLPIDLDTSGLSNGVYFLRVRGDHFQKTHQFVVSK